MGERKFGAEIARLRKREGYTIREFARKVLKEDGEPMSPSYLCDIEQGRKKPASEVIRRMAEILKADFDDLMNLAQRTPPDIKEYLQETPQLGRLLRKARETGFKDWGKMEELIEDHEKTHAKKRSKKTDRSQIR